MVSGSGFLLWHDLGIGRGGDFGFGFCRYLNSGFDPCLGLRLRSDFGHGLGLGALNVLGAHGLEVLLTALFLVGLLGSLQLLGLSSPLARAASQVSLAMTVAYRRPPLKTVSLMQSSSSSSSSRVDSKPRS